MAWARPGRADPDAARRRWLRPVSAGRGRPAATRPPAGPVDARRTGDRAGAAVGRQSRVDGARLPGDRRHRRSGRTRSSRGSSFDEEALAELEHSIREFGLLQPIVVREVERRVATSWSWASAGGGPRSGPGWTGSRRSCGRPPTTRCCATRCWRTSTGSSSTRSRRRRPTSSCSPSSGSPTTELADRIGRSRPVVTNTIRLLKLPVPVQRRVAAGVLSAGHARALLGLDDPEQQEELAARIVAEGLSVRATEEAVLLARREASQRPTADPPHGRCTRPACRTWPSGCRTPSTPGSRSSSGSARGASWSSSARWRTWSGSSS